MKKFKRKLNGSRLCDSQHNPPPRGENMNVYFCLLFFRDCTQNSLLALKHLRKNEIHLLIFQLFHFPLKAGFLHISAVTRVFSRSPLTSVLLLAMRNSVCSQPNLNTHTHAWKKKKYRWSSMPSIETQRRDQRYGHQGRKGRRVGWTGRLAQTHIQYWCYGWNG